MAKERMKRKPIKASNIWKCLNCASEPEFQHKDAMVHIREVHGIDTKNTKASRTVLMHLDAADYFSSTWMWEIKGMKFVQYVATPRDKSDPMSMNHY